MGNAHFDDKGLTTTDFPIYQADNFALLEKIVFVKSDEYILSHPLTFLDIMEMLLAKVAFLDLPDQTSAVVKGLQFQVLLINSLPTTPTHAVSFQ